nr:class I SAM-dependent methyltransferase [Candidatus Njordarchaeota archaeon]
MLALKQIYEEQGQFVYLATRYHHVKRRKTMLKLINQLISDKCKLLDIGCGDGWYTFPISKVSRYVIGLDISINRIKRVKKGTLNVDVISADANHLPLRGPQFDIIVAAQFLEHIPKPKAMVTRLSKLLSKEGILLIEVPSKTNLLDILAVKLTRREPKWGLDIDPTHIHFFDMYSLLRVFQSVNLRVLKVTGAVHSNYVFPMISFMDSKKKSWFFLDIIEKVLGLLKPDWGSIQVFVLQKEG